MDGGDDINSSFGEVLEVLNDIESRGRVESGSRLIEEQHSGVSEELDSDGGSLSLSSGDSSDEFISDSCVLTFLESEFDDDIFDSPLLFLETDFGESEIGDEGESFSGSEGSE